MSADAVFFLFLAACACLFSFLAGRDRGEAYGRRKEADLWRQQR